jgi:outer membrane protein OmpA-like peptidoglycan-associated protein
MNGRRMTAGVVVAAVAVATAGGGAWARTAQEGEPRVRELHFRVRDLTYRTNSLDNSERVEETPEQISVTLAADVLFEYGKADLTAAANAKLDDLAGQLSDLGPREVTIEGHTDSDGDDAANQDLSERRAAAVEAALGDRVDSDFTFSVSGKGETEPVAPNEHDDGADNPDGRALNRRVEITFPT